jgi:KaiC/GvpD/RAD55 family RecA-like ATPase
MAQEDDAVAVYQQLVRRPRGGTTIRSPKTRTTTSPAHASTGNQRLDEFLGGGLARGGATLLYGPPFSGKGVLQRTMFLAGLRQKAQSVFLLTDMAAPDFVDRVQLMDPRFREFQEEDLFHFVDAYSHLIGEKAPMAQTTFVPDLRSLDRILKAVEQVEAKLKARGQTIERLYVQSLSTMIMEAGTGETFRFLRALVGRVVRRGGTVIAGLETGMHHEPEVQAIKHLSNGMLQTRESDGRVQLRADGIRAAVSAGWIEYRFSPEQFELVGSFAPGRIGGARLA